MLKVAQATSPTPLDEFAAAPKWLPADNDPRGHDLPIAPGSLNPRL
jgi:hypothetical protein